MNTKVINKIDDKNDSTILDSYIPKNKNLNKPKIKDNEENINNKNLKDSKTKNKKKILIIFQKILKIENKNKKTKNTKKLNLNLKKLIRMIPRILKIFKPCSTLIKDSDICLDNFLE